HVSASSAIYTLSLHDALPIYQPPGFAPVYNPADSFLHFPGGLVGEGQGGYVPSGNAQLFNQVSDFSGDHAGFATASAGQHQQGAVCVANRFSLSWVELVHNIGAKKRNDAEDVSVYPFYTSGPLCTLPFDKLCLIRRMRR